MVTKVVTENDVDNVTIIINPQNQLESQVVVEEFADLFIPVTLTKDGKEYTVKKVGKIAGTNWLVLQAPKEVIRIPTQVLIEYTSVNTYNQDRKTTHSHRITYTFTPESNAELITGATAFSGNLDFNMNGIALWSSSSNTYTKRIKVYNTKGELEFDAEYPTPTSKSFIESVTASGAFSVETEDKIYKYELISPATVVDLRPAPSFTAELNCGDYTWTEETDDQGQYLLGTATQPATITVVPTNFTADDVSDIRLISDYGTYAERNGLVLTLSSELYVDVGATTYPIGDAIEVVFNDGTELRQDVRLECPITK